MRKKLILINSLIVFLSLVLMLVISSIIIYNKNYETYKNRIYNELKITVQVFDETGFNYDKTINIMNSEKNLRITFFDSNLNVIKDTDSNTKENHKDRPELQISNLGKVYKRYSNTERKEMLYVSALTNDTYIRLAMPMGNINQILKTYIIVGIIVILFLFGISLLLIFTFNKKSMNGIIEKVNDIGKLAKSNEIVNDITIEELSNILNSLSSILNERFNEIELQMEKFKTVLDLLKQGIIVITKDGIIKLVNQKCKELININDNIINNKYIFLFPDIELQNSILNAINNKKNNELIKNIDNKIILFNFNYIDNSWLDGGLIVTIEDITEDYNLEKTKKDFFQNASHELKSPLTSIIGYEQLIVEGIAEKDEIKEYSSKVLQEARRMNNIIIDMLDLASLEQNYQVKKEEVKVKEIIDNIISSLDNRIKEKNISLKLNINDDILLGDFKLIDEMIRNLIDNAIKYNKDNGEIDIKYDGNYFKIKDTGIGIKKEDQSRIFERFYHINNGKKNNGTGLGLAIVKHICELYNYEIKVESYIDIGTSFEIKLK